MRTDWDEVGTRSHPTLPFELTKVSSFSLNHVLIYSILSEICDQCVMLILSKTFKSNEREWAQLGFQHVDHR